MVKFAPVLTKNVKFVLIMPKKQLKSENSSGTALQEMESLSPGGDLQAYINSVHSIGILTSEEEKKLAEDLYYRNDLDAARKLVLAHLRFVIYIAKTYSGYGLPEADLIQEGNVGLMKAIRKFNPEMGVRLVSFAVHWVKAEIHEYVLKNWKIVKIATTKAQRKLFFNLRSKKKTLGSFTETEVLQVAEDLGVAASDVRQMEARLQSNDETFDSEEEAFGANQFLENSVGDPAKIIENNDLKEAQQQKFVLAFSKLDKRLQEIIQKRWLDEPKSTLANLSREFGVSAERIRQLEQIALNKLKQDV